MKKSAAGVADRAPVSRARQQISTIRLRQRHTRRFGYLVICLLFLCSCGMSQTANVTDATLTPKPGIGHNYEQLLNETVNPANGSVSLNFTIPVPKLSAGPAIPFGLAYNSNSVETLAPYFAGSGPGKSALQPEFTGGVSNQGWSVLIPHITMTTSQKSQLFSTNPNKYYYCDYYSDYTFVDETGQSHPLGLSYPAVQLDGPAYDCSSMTEQPTTVTSGGDGGYSGVQASAAAYFDPVVVNRNRDGDQFTFTITPSNQVGVPSTSFQYSITDRNGNSATPGYTVNQPSVVCCNDPMPTTVSVVGLNTPFQMQWIASQTNTVNWNANFQQVVSDGSPSAMRMALCPSPPLALVA